jgi:hypothetical protein
VNRFRQDDALTRSDSQPRFCNHSGREVCLTDKCRSFVYDAIHFTDIAVYQSLWDDASFRRGVY